MRLKRWIGFFCLATILGCTNVTSLIIDNRTARPVNVHVEYADPYTSEKESWKGSVDPDQSKRTLGWTSAPDEVLIRISDSSGVKEHRFSKNDLKSGSPIHVVNRDTGVLFEKAGFWEGMVTSPAGLSLLMTFVGGSVVLFGLYRLGLLGYRQPSPYNTRANKRIIGPNP